MHYKTGYDTTVGRVIVTTKLDHALKEAMITGSLSSRRLGVEKVDQRTAIFVIGGDSSENQIPPFIHPFLTKNTQGEEVLVTDLRLFRTGNQEFLSGRDFETAVRNKTEYGLVKSRAILNLLWLGQDVEKIRARFNFAGSVFASWLSQAIAKSYALDFQDQLRITAVGIYYYHCLFTTETRLAEGALETAVIHTINATKLPATEVYALFESLGEVHSIEDYCSMVQKVVENVRLKDFNLVMLLTLIRNSWYGTNAKELLCVALEHPPTWISIVYTTMTERTYKSSALYKLIEMCSRRGSADEFRMNYLELIKDTEMVYESIAEELTIREFEG